MTSLLANYKKPEDLIGENGLLKGNVYVVTGPVCNQGSKTIGDSRVCVPDHIFKLVYDEAEQRAWAHWHANPDDARGSAPICYRELVQRTGIDFLPGADL